MKNTTRTTTARRLSTAALAATALLAASSSAPAAAPQTVDSSVTITSQAPVPGLMTAGQFTIANKSATPLKAGAAFRVTFEDMRGTSSASSHTVTCPSFFSCTAVQDPHNSHSFIVTLRTPLSPGQQVSGLWSNHHFLNGTRDRVIMTTERLDPSQSDANTENNSNVFDNWGRGF